MLTTAQCFTSLAQFSVHELQLELITRRFEKGQAQIRELELALENIRQAQAGRAVELQRLTALVFAAQSTQNADLCRTVTIPTDTAPLPLSIESTPPNAPNEFMQMLNQDNVLCPSRPL